MCVNALRHSRVSACKTLYAATLDSYGELVSICMPMEYQVCWQVVLTRDRPYAHGLTLHPRPHEPLGLGYLWALIGPWTLSLTGVACSASLHTCPYTHAPSAGNRAAVLHALQPLEDALAAGHSHSRSQSSTDVPQTRIHGTAVSVGGPNGHQVTQQVVSAQQVAVPQPTPVSISVLPRPSEQGLQTTEQQAGERQHHRAVFGGEGAIYLWARLPAGCEACDESVVQWLVQRHGVAVVPGSACGSPGVGV